MAKIELDTNNHTWREVPEGGGGGCLGLIVIGLLLLAFAGGDGNSSSKTSKNLPKTSDIIEIVNHYCSVEQLPKTGLKPCLDAKNDLLPRYRESISDKQAELEQLQQETPKLIKEKENKCSSQGILQYGSEGCNYATEEWQTNVQDRKACIKEIEEYEDKIKNLAKLGIDTSFTHVINADVLNLRSCAGSNCEVIKKLRFGEGVIYKGKNGDWVDVADASGKMGFVSPKFLLENKANSPTSPSSQSTQKSDNIINSSASTQPKTTDFRDVNWANASYQDIISIINAGANINQIYEEGITVLMLAIDMSANPSAIKALIDKGANVNIKDEKGYTALHFSSYQENPQLIELLVKNGANINATDSSEMTPLMLAAKDNNNPEIITTLIKSGADVNKRSMGDMTAIDYAAYGNKNPKILEALLQQGARADENTFNWAKENENPNVLIFLKKYLGENAKSSKKIFGLPIF